MFVMFYDSDYYLSWWLCVKCKRQCVLLLLKKVFYKCQLVPVDRWRCSVQPFPYWFFPCWIYQLLIKWYSSLQHHSKIIFESHIFPWSWISFVLWILILFFNAYTLRTKILPWCINHFLLYDVSLILIIFLALKYNTSKINTATPTFFWLVLAGNIFVHFQFFTVKTDLQKAMYSWVLGFEPTEHFILMNEWIIDIIWCITYYICICIQQFF